MIDGAPVKSWIELVNAARGYGYSGQSITAEAIKFLRDHGHTVEEQDATAPEPKTDEKQSQKRKRFFALSRENGHNAQVAKERAKAHFEVESFNDLTDEQLDWLITRLEQQKARKGGEQQ